MHTVLLVAYLLPYCRQQFDLLSILLQVLPALLAWSPTLFLQNPMPVSLPSNYSTHTQIVTLSYASQPTEEAPE